MSASPPPGTPAPSTNAPPEVSLRVVSGSPTDEELAALVVVLAGLALEDADDDGVATSTWSSPGTRHRTASGPRPGGWRASGLPR